MTEDTKPDIKIIDAETGLIEYYSNNKTWIRRKLGNIMTCEITSIVADDYRFFLEKNPTVFDHKFIDQLMYKIGKALGWDLDHGTYVFKDNRMISDQEYEKIATEIWSQTRKAILKI